MNKVKLIIFTTAGLVIFYFDTLIPLGYAPWLLYILLLFIYISYTEKQHIAHLAILYAVLIIIGYFLSPPLSAVFLLPIINRSTAIIVIIMFAVLAMREKEAKKISSEILERIKDLFIALDKKLKIIFINKSAQDFIGIKNDASIEHVKDLFPGQQTKFIDYLNQAADTQVPLHFEMDFSEIEKALDVSIYPSQKGLSVFARDIRETVLSERRLKKVLNEKENLLKELQHRTKNNLQLILSLLNLQLNTINDETSVRILNETRSRIFSITSLYDKLFLSGSVYTVDLKLFITDIVVHMHTAANFGLVNMKHDIDIENATIRLDDAIPLGLIINELYTNSLKYAFKGNIEGEIKINMKFEDHDILHVYYKDNGRGLPDGFDFEKSTGVGSSIVLGFVNQLKGKISYVNNSGAEFNLKLKICKENDVQETMSLKDVKSGDKY